LPSWVTMFTAGGMGMPVIGSYTVGADAVL